MEADLKIAGYSPSTQTVYLFYARKFAGHFMRSPTEMGAEEVRQFLHYLVEERCIARSTLRQVRSSLRFLYSVTLNRPVAVEWLPVPRKQERLPVVLSGTEIAALLDAVRVPKYRAIMMAMYAGGLRISEACRLRPEQIDSKRRVIRIRGKGDKERLTLLSHRLLEHLRSYWRFARPQGEWLFPGRTQERPVGTASARQVFSEAARAAGIAKDVTPHSLRHSFATHLIETGVDVTVVKELLGHRSLQTTEVYTHTSVERIARTKSPLDLLGTPDGRILG
jgi:site-specific recombinase XerD